MRKALAILAALAFTCGASATPTGSAFTYQGQLNVSGTATNSPVDLQFKLFDAPSGGTQIGSTVNAANTSVAHGLFTVSLDFGHAAFNGDARWLEIGVKPAGQAVAYTVLTPRQFITPAPYANGLSLPFATTVSDSGTLLSITNNNLVGSGIGAATTGGTALYGQTSTGTGVWGYNLGASGSAGLFRNENVTNTMPALRVEANGGDAGNFQVQASASAGTAVNASTVGTGRAGSFTNTNAANGATTLFATTNGLGNTLAATNTGTGRAGVFQISNAGSAATALEAITNGSGLAGKFTGNVDVVGHLTATFGASGQHRATPIAYGAFSLDTTATSTLSGSGNVTVTYLGNDVYRVNVTGESSPSTWIVEANVIYSNPGNPDWEFANLRVGAPDASGRFQIYCPCTSGCGSFTAQSFEVHYVVYKP